MGALGQQGADVDADSLARRLNVLEALQSTGGPVNATSGLILARSLIRNVSTLGRPIRIIPAGDSITQNNSTFASGLWQYGAGYAEVSIMQSGARYRILRNAGISGNTSAQLLARIQTDVIAYAPDVCMVMIGTNDFVSGMASSAYSSLFNNVEQIVLALLKAGILPVIVTPPPRDVGTTEAKNAQWYYYALAQYYGLPLIDMFRTLVDASTGTYASGNSSDGIHPIAAGITKMIAAATPVLSSLAGSACAPYLAAVSEASGNAFANILRNGAFALGTSGAPTGWTVNSTGATPTSVAATQPYTGNTFTYNKTVGGAAFALSGGSPSVAGGGFSVGDTLQMNVRMKVSGLTPATATGYQLRLEADSGGILRTNGWVQNGDMVFSSEFTVPAATTTLTPTLFVQDVSQYEVSNWTVFNVTKANAIWQPGQQGA